MKIRTRKFVGTVVLVVFLTVYCLLAMTVGAERFAGTSVVTQTLYFIVAGTAWVIPATPLIWWMQRPDPE